MKTRVLVFCLILLTPCILLSQKLKYDESLDSLWSTNGYVNKISDDGNWAVICEYSSYRPSIFHLVNTHNSETLYLGNIKFDEFSNNSQWLAYKNSKEELELLNLKSEQIEKLGEIESFSFNFSGDKIAFLENKEDGRKLIIRDLIHGEVTEIMNVEEFRWSPKRDYLIVNVNQKEKNRVYGIAPFKSSDQLYECVQCTFSRFTWDQNGDFLVFLEKINENKKLHFTGLNGEFKSINDTLLGRLFPKFSIDDYNLEITKDKNVFFYRIKESFGNLPREENVEISRTDDHWIYSREKMYEWIKRHLLTLWNPMTEEVIAIEDECHSSSITYPDLSFALIYNIKKYEPQYEQYPYADIFLLDLESGVRKLIIEKLYTDHSYISISPSGNHIAFFKENNWWIYDLKCNTVTNLTSELLLNWINTNLFRKDHPHFLQTALWSDDSKYLILHDEYDIWKMSLDGKIKERITKGKEKKISHSIYINTNDNSNLKKTLNNIGLSINFHKPLLLKTESSDLKKGFSILNPDGVIEPLFLETKNIENIYPLEEKSIMFSQSLYNEAPEFYRLDLISIEKILLWEINSELKNYDFGKYEIFNYSTDEFKDLNGVLLYPSNYNPVKKYPMIVFPYEINSKKIYKYSAPSDRLGFNIMKYINNGYFILLPDIKYKIGQPGFSSLECIEKAVEESLSLNTQIDSKNLGLIGHSFGGYQSAFIASQTDLFKAVVAGAAATDLVSFYQDNWYSISMNQAWRFESQQFRMGDNYYNMKENYWRNSPLYHVENMETPLLLWTGRHDTNINWYQSVFMFNAMKRLNKPGKLIIFNDEDHSLVKPDNQERLSKEIFDWFEFYLKKQ